MNILNSESFLLKSLLALTIFVMTIIILKVIVSSCLIFPIKNKCQVSQEDLTSSLSSEIDMLEVMIRDKELALVSKQCSDDELVVESVPPAVESSPPLIDVPAWEKGEIAALDGCWLLDSNYKITNENTGLSEGIASWTMCFEKDNNYGSQTLIYENRIRSCIAQPVKRNFQLAKSQSYELVLDDTKEVNCSDGFRIFRRLLTCKVEKAGDFAQCSTQQFREGIWNQTSSNVRLRRSEGNNE